MRTLRDLRKAAGITQVQLGSLLAGVRGGAGYQGPVSSIERGEVSPTVRRLADILTVLGYQLRVEACRKGQEPIPLDLPMLLGRLARDPQADPGSPGPEPEPVQDPAPELQSELPKEDPSSLEETILKAFKL